MFAGMSSKVLTFGTVAFILASTPFIGRLASSQTAVATTAANKAVVARSFEAWAAGNGGPYDLLADDVRWTIAGRSAAARTYPSREAFLSEVIRPFNARMREPLRPTLRGIHADGDTVIVLFDARSIARDGVPYTNTYSWHLRIRNARIVEATAFFDSIAFDEMWTRVSPEETALTR